MAKLMQTDDVFLCHSSKDKEAVEQIGRELKARNIKPWLDIWDLRPGLDWIEEIENKIETIGSVAVFVGPNDGFGPWQKKEIRALLREQTRRGIPVIPVILPGVEGLPELPPFLRAYTWVDFRNDERSAYLQLVWGITGEKPPIGDKKDGTTETQLADLAPIRAPDEDDKPIVVLAPTTADLRKERKTLIDYCHNAGIRVVDKFPENSSDLKSYFEECVSECHLFVQLLSEYYLDRGDEFPDGREIWFARTAEEKRVRRIRWRKEGIDFEQIDDPDHADILRQSDVRPSKLAELNKRVREQARKALRDGPLSSQNEPQVIIKYNPADLEPTRAMTKALKGKWSFC